MAAYNKFQCFVEDINEKRHNLASDVLRMALTATAPTASQTSFSEATFPPPAAANGYPSTGAVVTVTSSAQTSGTYRLIISDVTYTASGGDIGPFRYAVFYNDGAAMNPLIAWWDLGASTTILSGATYTLDADQVNGIFDMV